jgi:2-C-methyl-D-erythritol 4-phosphate cytidylyltransferase
VDQVTRFKHSQVKQLFNLNNKPIIEYSIDIFETVMDYVIIVIILTIYSNISNIIENRPKLKPVINDINCRLKSIETGIVYIRENYKYVSNITIHDSARPFITVNHIVELQSSYEKGFLYSQYYLKLVNGLLKKNLQNFVEVDRNDFIEICIAVMYRF